MRGAGILVACLAALAGVALVARTAARPRVRNVVLVVVDTLRADRLSAWGYGRATSPHLDALARRAVRFTAARSQAPCTFPSANSLLTSRAAATFLGQPDGAMGIPAGVPSLAEMLQANDFSTFAVSASPIVVSRPHPRNPSGGFGRGFDRFHEQCVWRHAGCVNRVARSLLQRHSRHPLFLYLHYIDPHDPYRPPDGFARRFAARPTGRPWVDDGNPLPISSWLYKNAPRPDFGPADVRHLSDLYDDEVAYVDEQIGQLLAALDAAGLRDDTLVVVAADHGEEFLEHGDLKHCENLFDTTLHVPLIVAVPGARPRVITAPVSNLDVVPTILDYLGVDARPYRLEGRSLRTEIEGEERAPALQFALIGDLRSVSDGEEKLIVDVGARKPPLLFDLRRDPRETRNVLTRDRRRFALLRDALAARLQRTEGSGGLAASRAAVARLRALGYLE